jgi:hypothetical protein
MQGHGVYTTGQRLLTANKAAGIALQQHKIYSMQRKEMYKVEHSLISFSTPA